MKTIFASLAFLFSIFAAQADTVTGLVQVVGMKWSSGTKVVFTPTNTLRNINGAAVRSQPAEVVVKTNGSFSTSLIGPMGYKVAVGDTATYPTDVMNIFVPGDSGTYDWLSITTNSSMLSSNNAKFIGAIKTNGTTVGSQMFLNFVGSVLATNDPTNGKIDVAIIGGGGSGDVTTSILLNTSNALMTIMSLYDTTTSNALYSLIVGGGITAGTATNIAQYFATNTSIVTSNSLWAFMSGLSNTMNSSFSTTSNSLASQISSKSNFIVSAHGDLLVTNKLGIGTNAATATLEVQGTIKASSTIATDGSIAATSGSATIAAGGAYRFQGRGAVLSPRDGEIDLYNNSLSGFGALRLGGNSIISNHSSGVMLATTTGASATNLVVKNINVSQPSASSILASTASGWLTNVGIGAGLSYSGNSLSWNGDTNNFQPGNTTLTNLAGTGAITNLQSAGNTNTTQFALVQGGSNTTGRIKTISAGSGMSITEQGSTNLVLTATGSGSQTPWASDIDGGGYSLTNVSSVQINGTGSSQLLLGTQNTTGLTVEAPSTPTTNGWGVKFFASASVQEIAPGSYNDWQMTNNAGAAITLVFTNAWAGQWGSVKLPGAASGGSDYAVTVIQPLGDFVRFHFPTNGSTTFTRTNGQDCQLEYWFTRLNTTNVLNCALGRAIQ